MKRLIICAAVAAVAAGGMTSCSDFLDVKPVTNKNESDFVSKEGVTQLVTGMYASLNSSDQLDNPFCATLTNYVYGDVMGGDANKGSTYQDQPDFTSLETYSFTTDNGYLEKKWRLNYNSVFKANNVIKVANQCKDEIERWNKNNFIPQIRYWQECDILSFINRDRYLQCKYFKDDEDYTTMLIIDNIEEIKKLIFCANTNVETGSSFAPLEAISSIFELINDVVYDTQKYGTFKRKEECFGVDIFNFISAEMCRDMSVDKYTIKCVSSLLCAYLMGKKILLLPNDKGVEIKVEMKDDKIKYKLTENQCKLIRRLASLKQYTFEEKENYLFALQGW